MDLLQDHLGSRQSLDIAIGSLSLTGEFKELSGLKVYQEKKPSGGHLSQIQNVFAKIDNCLNMV